MSRDLSPSINPAQIRQKMVRAGYDNIAHPIINTKTYIRNNNNPSTIALVVNWGFHYFDQWPVAEYPFLIKAIINRFDPLIIPCQRAYERNKHKLDTVIALEPDQWMAPRIEYDTSCDHEIGIITGHPHSKTEWFPEYIQSNEIDHIFSRYYHPFIHYFPELGSERLVHFPWSVPEEFVVDPEDIECYDQTDIHIFGTYGHEMYTTREDIREYSFVNTSMRYETGHTVSKPLGYEDYYRWCRNFDAMIAAGSFEPKYQYTFAKYFEIPASGSLLFAQYCDDLDRLGFDDTNCMIFKSLDSFENMANNYLQEPSEYISIREKGAELIASRHTVSHRIEQLNSKLSIQ